MESSIPIVAIVGRSESGKTTLLEKLIPELKRRGYRIGIIKHTYRSGVEFDTPGKDSYRLAQAGADHVVLSTPDQIISVQQCEQELSLEELSASMVDVDLIIVEGHKGAKVPKIEVNRAELGTELISPTKDLLGIVSDQRFKLSVPQFGLDEAAGVADLLERFIRAQQKWDSAV